MQYKKKKSGGMPWFFVVVLALAVLAGGTFLALSLWAAPASLDDDLVQLPTEKPIDIVDMVPRMTQIPIELQVAPTLEPTPTPTPAPEMPLPAPVDGTRPGDFGFEVKVNVNGEDVSAYNREQGIDFGNAQQYTAVEGITTFRGNNYRNISSYGTAQVTQKKLSLVWEVDTPGMSRWTGSGWTGQPMLVKWPEQTRQIMNINADKKNKDGLVEVIYVLMNGYGYFMDIEDGKPTRERLKVDVFQSRGTGYDRDHMGGYSIDPRGYPLLYVGTGGDDTPGKDADGRFNIYSLIDQKLLYSFGRKDPFAPRNWTGWNSGPLIDAKTDTLIEPGESGILYTVKLNTDYNAETGALSISPTETAKLAYTTARSREFGIKKYWLGMETSASIWKNYLYTGDNGGHLMCINLNTMEVVWVQDSLDDTNSSPVFELDPDGQGYLYLSTAHHDGWRVGKEKSAPVPIWKINASTGEIVWQKVYDCYSYDGISGGGQATVLLGQGSISDLVIIPMARTPKMGAGVLVALNKYTGEEVWTFDIGGFSWSSTVAVYGEDGTAYLIQCNTNGWMYLLDGKTGALLDQIRLGERAIESTPAAFGNMIVVGTRGQKIYGVKIS